MFISIGYDSDTKAVRITVDMNIAEAHSAAADVFAQLAGSVAPNFYFVDAAARRRDEAAAAEERRAAAARCAAEMSGVYSRAGLDGDGP